MMRHIKHMLDKTEDPSLNPLNPHQVGCGGSVLRQSPLLCDKMVGKHREIPGLGRPAGLLYAPETRDPVSSKVKGKDQP